MEKKRNYPKEPWLAVILSSFLAGIGQIYTGRVSRGIILILTETTLICLSTWSLLIPKCDILITIGLLPVLVAVRIWNLFDAHKCARKTNPEDFEIDRKQNKDPFGLWAAFSTLICYHAYVSGPIRREKSKRTILIIAVAILCYHLLSYYKPLFRAYIAEAFRIPTPYLIPPELRGGSSMKPTLVYRDIVLVRKSTKYVPKRGDVVAFKFPEDRKITFIVRIAGLSGETIEIKDKILFINGQKVKWPTIEIPEYSQGKFGVEEPYKVPENCFFVLGDNTANSNDSRFFGPIPLSDLIGKAYKIYWPIGRSGPIE